MTDRADTTRHLLVCSFVPLVSLACYVVTGIRTYGWVQGAAPQMEDAPPTHARTGR